jgi:SAM-dependent methyltransferase
VGERLDYAFPHYSDDEGRRLDLFQERLDPLTIRRIERFGISRDAACLEIGAGRASITRWLANRVAPEGRVTATDVQPEVLAAIDMPNVDVLRHDIRTDTFPAESFDLVHTRAVLMHVPADTALLQRMVSWLRPGGWLLLEEPDFGMWEADSDPLWALHPQAWHRAFPNGSRSRGRWLLGQIPRLGLAHVGADAEVDIVAPGTPLAEFHRLSMEAIYPAALAAGALTADQATALLQRPTQPDFLSFGFVHVGVWGRKP